MPIFSTLLKEKKTKMIITTFIERSFYLLRDNALTKVAGKLKLLNFN